MSEKGYRERNRFSNSVDCLNLNYGCETKSMTLEENPVLPRKFTSHVRVLSYTNPMHDPNKFWVQHLGHENPRHWRHEFRLVTHVRRGDMWVTRTRFSIGEHKVIVT
jgi:hypothetical protein